eukprot:366546-Chlamydomonas_euryale.AAC.35
MQPLSSILMQPLSSSCLLLVWATGNTVATVACRSHRRQEAMLVTLEILKARTEASQTFVADTPQVVASFACQGSLGPDVLSTASLDLHGFLASSFVGSCLDLTWLKPWRSSCSRL